MNQTHSITQRESQLTSELTSRLHPTVKLIPLSVSPGQVASLAVVAKNGGRYGPRLKDDSQLNPRKPVSETLPK